MNLSFFLFFHKADLLKLNPDQHFVQVSILFKTVPVRKRRCSIQTVVITPNHQPLRLERPLEPFTKTEANR